MILIQNNKKHMQVATSAIVREQVFYLYNKRS